MGYYSIYKLTIVEGNDNATDYEKEISKNSEYGDGSYNVFGDETKWYNCTEDMLKFSKKHPDTLFLVEGSGGEQGDVWKKYFKNGKYFYTKAKMVFEKYSEDKLK